ncbi:MAG: methionyl-tRNA formyltransferase, partial [Campylobacter concisus]|nr:methionyl-tRNA formyltransferase [Campylobacter concisus]
MNVVFMGTPDYAVRILRHLKEAGFNIKAVFTQPDKPVGRKQILTPSEVKIYAQNELVGVPVLTPNTLKDEAVVAELKAFEPKFIVVAAYGKILPGSVLDVATCINLHASILPKYRGASPIQSAILAGEKQTGVTAMLMDAGL